MVSSQNAQAVEIALPGVAHGLCHFHYLREAAKVIYAADRHGKKELKKQVQSEGLSAVLRSMMTRCHSLFEVIV